MTRSLLLALALTLAACGEDGADARLAAEGPEALAELAVSVEAPAEGDTLDVRRAFFFSDKAGSFVYDAVAAPQDDPAMGFVAGGYRMLDGWRWWSLRDSVAFEPEDRVRGVVRPDFAARAYVKKDTSGFMGRLISRLQGVEEPRLVERVTMAEGLGALLIEIPDSIGTVAFRPVVSDRAGASDYQTEARGAALLIARGNFLTPREGDPRPVWVAVRAAGGEAVVGAGSERPEAGRRTALRLGEVRFPTPGAVVVATADTPEAADSLAARALRDHEAVRERRSARMAALLEEGALTTEDAATNHALAWARLALDALVVSDTSRAYLLPGIPGAEPPGGRSGLDALGALLATGRWDLARNLLTTYGRVQRFDERIDILGRAPNLVRPGDRGAFTTADATPLYIAAAAHYVRATGDRSLVSGGPNFWFKTVFAMRGLYQDSRRYGRQVTSEGFLYAPDGQTWMQGGAAREGLATPRGGAPVEGQGALYGALRAMTEFAQIMGVSQRESGRWYADSADVLLRDFQRRFVTDGLVWDGFDRRGQPASVLRPNGLLALARMDLPPEETARLTRALAERFAYAHGVGTRPQTDSLFHPFLVAPAYYSPDAALYNGPVWTWLNAPLIHLMARTGAAAKAAELHEAQNDLLLRRGVIGALPDVLDAHPPKEGGIPRAGGAPVQPWSLAGYIENAYRDFAGLHYAGPADVVLEPHLPAGWGETALRFRVGEGWVAARMRQADGQLGVALTPEGVLPEDAQVRVRAFGLEKAVPLVRMRGDTLAAEAVAVTVTPDGVEINGEDAEADARYDVADPAWWDGFAWVQPDVRNEYAVMRQAEAQRRLTADQILRDELAAQPILTQTDPDGDDWGATSTYVYPAGFPESILDATYLEVAEDDSTTYFRAEFVRLVGPDSLGFQPTFVAIALDTEPGGTRRIGRDALYDFPEGEGYEYVLFLGDGLVVEDAHGRVLGEVAPGQGSVFDPEFGALSFALPRFVLPDLPRGSTVVMLVGARAEGRGVGTFRPVLRVASGDSGGGKVDPRAPNVYDVVTATVSR